MAAHFGARVLRTRPTEDNISKKYPKIKFVVFSLKNPLQIFFEKQMQLGNPREERGEDWERIPIVEEWGRCGMIHWTAQAKYFGSNEAFKAAERRRQNKLMNRGGLWFCQSSRILPVLTMILPIVTMFCQPSVVLPVLTRFASPHWFGSPRWFWQSSLWLWQSSLVLPFQYTVPQMDCFTPS